LSGKSVIVVTLNFSTKVIRTDPYIYKEGRQTYGKEVESGDNCMCMWQSLFCRKFRIQRPAEWKGRNFNFLLRLDINTRYNRRFFFGLR
jgi:hypothetical protein